MPAVGGRCGPPQRLRFGKGGFQTRPENQKKNKPEIQAGGRGLFILSQSNTPMNGGSMQTVKKLWAEKPLLIIMIAAIAARLIAVLFAKGYAMSDDHFEVLELARNWLNGQKIDPATPMTHSIIYPGLHYLLFLAFKKGGLYLPDMIMYVVRLLHAALSLLTVWFGYRIVLLRADKKTAAEAGLLLAILWVFPFMSVRNLVEMVCIPFAVMGFYAALRAEDSGKAGSALFAGLLFGISFVIRSQTMLFAGGVSAVFLLRKQLRSAILFGVGFAVCAFAIQGSADWLVYGKPWATFMYNSAYNATHAYSYITLPWYTYIFTIMGALIPPTSLLLMFGFLRSWKRMAMLFWPTLLFLAFHSMFPNKQERFILPALPALVMLGVMGWREFAAQSAFWQGHRHLHTGLWRWFWWVNIILLAIVSTTYTKRSRVESMNYLHGRADLTAFVLETSDGSVPLPPTFYLDKKVPYYYFTGGESVDSLRNEIAMKGVAPNYVVMMNRKHFDERRERLRELFGDLEYCADIKPSIIDRVLFFLNPKHNVNEECWIYKAGGGGVVPQGRVSNPP
jgi:hypothetical protein